MEMKSPPACAGGQVPPRRSRGGDVGASAPTIAKVETGEWSVHRAGVTMRSRRCVTGTTLA
jgi:hypothetical protein